MNYSLAICQLENEISVVSTTSIFYYLSCINLTVLLTSQDDVSNPVTLDKTFYSK